MSMDAGGLAQMTFNNNNMFGNGIGVPNAGFASRGKGSTLKRLSVAPISENTAESNGTPRTGRLHLLAGLRTAPKGQAPPQSAPFHQHQHAPGPNGSRFPQPVHAAGQGMPQTATGSTFRMNNGNSYGMNDMQHSYAGHEQILAPPSLYLDPKEEMLDPQVAVQLMQSQAQLAARGRELVQLQQRLQYLSFANQQSQGMNMNGNMQTMHQAQYMNPQLAMLQQQVQPVVQEVPGNPGVYSVFNPMTGQTQFVTNNQYQQQAQMSNSPPPPTPTYTNAPPRMQTPQEANPMSPMNSSFPSRNPSPPKKSPSPPVDVQPLPPPSANAFRRGHKMTKSFISDKKGSPAPDSVNSSRTSGIPQTPMTGTFGPGQNRAGEHPVRQPRGPPQLEELVAKPTTKHEGSKNFVTRQRRSAVSSLVRKGLQRRCVRTGSGDSYATGSEPETGYYLNSDDSDSVQSNASASRKISVGTIRSHASGVIGSERKARRDCSWDSSTFRSKSSSRDALKNTMSILEGDVTLEEPPKCSTPGAADRMTTPLLVLTKAEKRKTSIF